MECLVQMTNCSQDSECQLRMLSVMSRYWKYTVAQKYLTLDVEYVASSVKFDRLCGLVVRVSGYRYRGPGFDPRRYQIF